MKEVLAASASVRGKPTLFEEYFGMGKGEEVSPFLASDSRTWAAHLSLKASLLAALLLAASFLLYFWHETNGLAALCLAGTYFLAGTPSLIDSIEDLIDFDVNIDMLMTLAAFSSVLIGSPLEGGLLLVLFSLSGSMEDYVTSKARGSLNRLQKISPTKATVVDSQGHLIEKSVRDIEVGALILVRAGEVVPLDGKVMDGISSVNLVHLTGESLPVKKEIGNEVPAGARNLEGALYLKVIHTSAESTLTKIIELVVQAQEAKPQLQKWFDRLSQKYALAIIGISFLTALLFPLFWGLPFLGYEGSVYRAVSFLIAASPCALILALPIAYLSAVSACAQKGVLLKGGTVLDQLAGCSAIAFDKTGTLTTGQLTCSKIEPLEGDFGRFPLDVLVAAAYGLEKSAVHPIAQAVNAYAAQMHLPSLPIKEFRSIPGYGVEGFLLVGGRELPAFMGHPDYVLTRLPEKQRGLLEERIRVLQQEGSILAVLLLGDEIFLFSFEDQMRPGMVDTIERLQQMHQWRLLMLSGDHQASAERVAAALGIREVHANLKPEDKLAYVTSLSEKQGLAMVGDGINDAPALARATVGICMGKIGSGMAMDAADVILLQDNLEFLDWLMAKAKQTETIVRQNLMIAAGAILIASVPALAGWVPLWLAVILHEGGTVLVGLNALRLLR